MHSGIKGSWGSSAIVSIGLELGGSGGRFPAGEEAFVERLPCQDWSMWPFSVSLLILMC